MLPILVRTVFCPKGSEKAKRTANTMVDEKCALDFDIAHFLSLMYGFIMQRIDLSVCGLLAEHTTNMNV